MRRLLISLIGAPPTKQASTEFTRRLHFERRVRMDLVEVLERRLPPPSHCPSLGAAGAESQVRRGVTLTRPGEARTFLCNLLADEPHEMFAVVLDNAQHRVTTHEEGFRRTLTQRNVFPREVVKPALMMHSASVVNLAHNHPSGSAEPSRADENLNRTLKDALALVDVRVLDHLIVTRGGCTSMAERGLV